MNYLKLVIFIFLFVPHFLYSQEINLKNFLQTTQLFTPQNLDQSAFLGEQSLHYFNQEIKWLRVPYLNKWDANDILSSYFIDAVSKQFIYRLPNQDRFILKSLEDIPYDRENSYLLAFHPKSRKLFIAEQSGKKWRLQIEKHQGPAFDFIGPMSFYEKNAIVYQADFQNESISESGNGKFGDGALCCGDGALCCGWSKTAKLPSSERFSFFKSRCFEVGLSF